MLAIVFTAAKAFDTIPNLSNISYAWGLLPILVWVAVAYVRRCRRYNDLEQQTIGFRNRAEGLARLAALRERGVALRNKAVNTQPEMEQWLKANAQWLNEVYGVVGAVSVSLAARIRTLGTVGPNVTEVS